MYLQGYWTIYKLLLEPDTEKSLYQTTCVSQKVGIARLNWLCDYRANLKLYVWNIRTVLYRKMNWDKAHKRSLQIKCSDKYSKRPVTRDSPNKQVQSLLVRPDRQRYRPGLRPLSLERPAVRSGNAATTGQIKLVTRPMRNSAVRGSSTAVQQYQNCRG